LHLVERSDERNGGGERHGLGGIARQYGDLMAGFSQRRDQAAADEAGRSR